MNVDAASLETSRPYFPIYLDCLRVDEVLDFDLYIERAREYVLYRSAAQPFTEKTRDALLENNIKRLFVSSFDFPSYQKYLEINLPELTRDASIRETVRAGLVYESALHLIKDLFSKPAVSENVRRSQELVASTVGFVLTSKTAFASLLEIMAYDYTTYTHSINVCALSLALALHIGINNPRDLQILGTGALLHDIGKTRVPESILNKLEPLTPDEMFVIQRHPKWGCDLAKQTDLLEEESYFPILQHHEREDGSGYPNGIAGKQIHLYGKITAIADVFDAMTTRRAYRPAFEAYPALRQMFEDKDEFDSELLSAFTRMLGPSEEDEN